jgi:hypothetical protein
MACSGTALPFTFFSCAVFLELQQKFEFIKYQVVSFSTTNYINRMQAEGNVNAMRSLIKLNALVTCRLPVETATSIM